MSITKYDLGYKIFKLRQATPEHASKLIHEWTVTRSIDRAAHQALCEYHYGGKPVTDPDVLRAIEFYEKHGIK